MKKQAKKITAEDFDQRFDRGEDMANFLDVKKAQMCGLNQCLRHKVGLKKEFTGKELANKKGQIYEAKHKAMAVEVNSRYS